MSYVNLAEWKQKKGLQFHVKGYFHDYLAYYIFPSGTYERYDVKQAMRNLKSKICDS